MARKSSGTLVWVAVAISSGQPPIVGIGRTRLSAEEDRESWLRIRTRARIRWTRFAAWEQAVQTPLNSERLQPK